jgi:hypothetical protein
MSEVQSKECLACGVEKTAGEFSKHSGRKDGLADYCKTCRSEMQREQRAGTYVSRLRDNEIIVDGEIGRVPVKTKDGIRYALIDARFAEAVSKARWFDDGRGYPSAKIDKQKIKLHRYIMILNGELIDELHVDHISRDIMDSRLENLRAVDRATNLRNSGARTGRFKGVSWHKQTEKWSAQIVIDGRKKHLGYFSIEQIAARAYDWTVITEFPNDLHAETNFDRTDYEGFSSREDMLAHYTALWEGEQAAVEQSSEDDPFCAADDDDDESLWN